MSDIDDKCEVCEQYDKAEKDIKGVMCPVCNAEMFPEDPFENLKPGDTVHLEPTLSENEIEVIGEHNGIAKQKFIKAHVRQCQKCREYIAFIPTKISYNANHDIFHTEDYFKKFQKQAEMS